jgi:hypothetical protein
LRINPAQKLLDHGGHGVFILLRWLPWREASGVAFLAILAMATLVGILLLSSVRMRLRAFCPEE